MQLLKLLIASAPFSLCTPSPSPSYPKTPTAHHTSTPSDSCAICLDPVTSPFYHFTCTHTSFHPACIYTHESKSPFNHPCPLCRASPNPPLPHHLYTLALNHIFDDNLHPFTKIIHKFIPSDKQVHGFIRCAMGSSVYEGVLLGSSVRNWEGLVLFFYTTFISDVGGVRGMWDMGRKRRLVIGMGGLTQGHVRMHEVCIRKRQWDCSDAFFGFYEGQIGNVDFEGVLRASVIQHVHVEVVAQLAKLPSVCYSDYSIFAAVRLCVDVGNWRVLSMLIELTIVRASDVNRTMTFLLKKNKKLPLFILIKLFHSDAFAEANVGSDLLRLMNNA